LTRRDPGPAAALDPAVWAAACQRTGGSTVADATRSTSGQALTEPNQR